MVVTGREGQVVRSLVEHGDVRRIEVVPLGRPELELAGPEQSISAAIKGANPDVIVSAAAYTQVDSAEGERELTFEINERGARAIARAAQQLGVPLIHLSTDYVFDGLKAEPYFEGDPTNPTGAYGASKLAGERAVMEVHGNSAVLRTAWVYSPFGNNFVKTMLRLARERGEISVVADQRGNPTSALDIAHGIMTVAANLLSGSDPALRGVFHMSAEGEASWAEFAEAIFGSSRDCGGPAAAVKPIRTSDYPTAAKRPVNSRLNSDKIAMTHGVRLPNWRTSLQIVVERLVQAEA